MNRHRLAALITAGAVLAGVFGVLSGNAGVLRLTRTWADPGSSVSTSALLAATRAPAQAPTKAKPKASRPTSAPEKAKSAPSGSGKGGTVLTVMGRTWT